MAAEKNTMKSGERLGKQSNRNQRRAEYRECGRNLISGKFHVTFYFPTKTIGKFGDVENNNKSIVFTLTYGGTKVLLLPMPKELEEYLVQKYAGDILDACPESRASWQF